jgi:type I restriction-modification system DNA methylase subunit
MALKKSELYSSLWAGCDELRGGMDASQYKDCAAPLPPLTAAVAALEAEVAGQLRKIGFQA